MSLFRPGRRRPASVAPVALDLSRWTAATRVEVRTNLAVVLKVVEAVDRVAQLAQRAADLGNEGWSVPPKGVPVAGLRFEFYDGESMLGSLGVEDTFLSVHQIGRFWSRPADPSVRTEFLTLAGVSSPDATT